MSHVDWDKIKAEYLQGDMSQRKLAEKYNVSYSTLRDRANNEEWAKKREEIRSKAVAKSEQEIVSQRAEDIKLLDRSRTLLIKKLAKAIEKYPETPGNRIEQSIVERFDDATGNDKKMPKEKTVRVESDIVKMITALEKLMAMSGYDVAGHGADVPVLLDWRPEDE